MKELIKKYFPFDAGYYLRSGSWLVFGQMILVALVFLSSVAFTNVFTPTEYGAYRYLFSMLTLLALPTLTEMSTAVTRSVAQGERGAVWVGFLAKIRFGFLGLMAALGVAGYYLFQGNTLYAIGFSIIALTIPFSDAFGLYDAYLQGKKRFRESTITTLLIQLVYTGLVIGIIFLTKNILLVAMTALVSLLLLKVIPFVRLFYAREIVVAPATEVLSFGKHLSLIKGLNILSGTVYSIFLYHVVGAPALAMFYVAQGPLEQLRGFLTLGENLIITRFSDPKRTALTGWVFLKKLLPILGGVAIVVTIYLVLAPTFFRLIFPRYVNVVGLSQIYAFSLFFTATNILLTSMLKAQANVRALHAVNIMDIVLNLAGIIPAIYFFGIPGLIGGIIVMKILEGIYMSYFLFRKPSVSSVGV